MQFYLINLDRSPDRLAWIIERLNELSITPQRVPAVDGKQLSPHEVERWERVRHPRFGMGPGEFACFLSHRKVWELIVNGDEDWAFIAEDDIHISDHLPAFLLSEDWIPAGASMIKAETAKQRVWLSSKSVAQVYSRKLNILKSFHGGSAAYFVNKKTAVWLLRETNDFCTTVDQLLFNPDFKIARNLSIYQIDPALAVQDWAYKSKSAGASLESLLLNERAQFHGVKQAKSQRGLAYIWYKVSNPLVKSGRRGLAIAANTLGTHSVKKVAFEPRRIDAA